MKDFFSWLLGNKWRTKLLLYTLVFIILLLFPILIFLNKIKFDPAKFTEEWSKIVVTLSLLYLILEYQKFSSEKNKSLFELKKTIKNDLLFPLEDIFQNIHKFETHSIEEIKKKWIKFYKHAKKISFTKYNIIFPDEKIYTFKESFELKFINNYFQDYTTNEEINTTDYIKMKDNLKELIELLKKTHVSI